MPLPEPPAEVRAAAAGTSGRSPRRRPSRTGR